MNAEPMPLPDEGGYPGAEEGCPPSCPDMCDTHGHPYAAGQPVA